MDDSDNPPPISLSRVCVICPPFYSHFAQLLALATSLRDVGAMVTMACTEDFAPQISEAGLAFYALRVTTNSNTGIAAQTQQAQSEKERLEAFFEASRQGAIPTLLLQTHHRRQDMLANPHGVRDAIAQMHAEVRPDWYVIDQLSYAVTLALYCLRHPFATISPGHPTYITRPDGYFGFPYAWPRAIQPGTDKLDTLREAVQQTDHAFTQIFNEVREQYDPTLPRIPRAFGLTSSHALIFNYPELGDTPLLPDQRHIWMGHSVAEVNLPDAWQERLNAIPRNRRRFLIAFGTFLSVRDDVIRRVIEGIHQACPDALLIVGAGSQVEALTDLQGDDVWIYPFVPQRALLPHVDAMVHHGGNNSFTECLYFGVPAIIMPFSSDQFSIAHDAENANLARVLDPNHATVQEISDVVATLFAEDIFTALDAVRQQLHTRGPRWAAPLLLRKMANSNT